MKMRFIFLFNILLYAYPLLAHAGNQMQCLNLFEIEPIIRWTSTLDQTKSSKFPGFKSDSANIIVDNLLQHTRDGYKFPPMGARQPWEMKYQEFEGKDNFGWILDWNSEIQNKIFGSVLFSIKEAKKPSISIKLNSGFEGVQNADVHGSLLISTHLLETWKKISPDKETFQKSIKMVVAHELAHYAYEWHIAIKSENHISPNGGLAFDYTPNLKEFYLKNPAIANMKEDLWTRRMAVDHAEIDWIALEFMNRMGQTMTWVDYKNFVNSLYQSISASQDSDVGANDRNDKDYLSSIEIRIRTIANSWVQ